MDFWYAICQNQDMKSAIQTIKEKLTANMEGSTLHSFTQKVPDIVCFSKQKWDLTYQYPQNHLNAYMAESRVFFIEEPVFKDATHGHLDVDIKSDNLWVVVPTLPSKLSRNQIILKLRNLVDTFFEMIGFQQYILWYNTAMALPFSRHLNPEYVVYDVAKEEEEIESPETETLQAELINKSRFVVMGEKVSRIVEKIAHIGKKAPISNDFKGLPRNSFEILSAEDTRPEWLN
jgi:UDP-galactopyranose mutase